MNIAIAHADLPTDSKGGVAFQVHQLANQLVKTGNQVCVFTSSERPQDALYTTRSVQLRAPFKYLKPFEFGARVAQQDFKGYDIVHSHGDNFLMWRDRPQVRTFHGAARDERVHATSRKSRFFFAVISMLERFSAQIADVNVGVSKATCDAIPGIHKIIPCGVDLSQFRPGSRSKRPSILFVGSMRGRKRGDKLVEVFLREVRSKIPDAELWCVTSEAPRADGVIHYGKVDQGTLCSLYSQAWLYCSMSTYEGFGIPYVEAMASGAAVVSTPNPGAREVLADGIYGVLPGDEEFGSTIVRLLQNAEQRQEFTTRGAERAQRFALERVALEYQQLYHTLATGRIGSNL